MKTQLLLFLLLLGVLCTPLPMQAEVRRALPSSAFKEGEEIQRPIPFSEQELRVLRNLETLPSDRLTELLVVYEKLNNDAMCALLVRQILKRDPKNVDALRVNAELDPDEEVRPVGYLDQLSRLLLSGQKVGDPDGIAVQANVLLLENHARDAVLLLEALRRNNYEGKSFPYDEDLAGAYQEAGQYEESADLYTALLNNPATPPSTRIEAQKSLATVALLKRIATIREQSIQDPESGVALSTRLLREHPDHPLVVSFHVECLKNAGHHAEAIHFLQDKKERSLGNAFLYQESLAFAYYGAKDYTHARQAFMEIKGGAYDAETQVGADQMLATIRLDEMLDRGGKALKQSDLTTAKLVLEEAEREFPRNPDVFAYRFLVMAKSGHSEEALNKLLQMKQDAAEHGRLFTELDTLADVHAERKEYALARSAYEDIISNPDYDAAMRTEAVKDLEETKQLQMLDEAYRALSDGRVKDAVEMHQQLAAKSPGNHDVELLGADITLATGNPREALAEYQRLKSGVGDDAIFSGQGGLAEAHYRLGQWEDALTAYNEIIDRPGFDADEVWSAIWDRRGLLPYVNHHLITEVSMLNESEGDRFSQSLDYTSAWWGDWRVLVRARHDQVKLDGSQSLLRARGASYLEAEAGVQRRLPNGHFIEATAGGAEDTFLYGARVGKFPSTGVGWGSVSWSFGFSGNARADYGLPLQVLNGREDRVEFLAEGYLNPRLRFQSEAHGSLVHVDGEDLGFGYGLGATVEYILQTENRKRPEIALGYRGEYSRFKHESELPGSVTRALGEDGKPEQVRRALPREHELRKALAANYGREIFNSLVDPETNRHGVQVSISKRLDTTWNAYVQGGVYRDFGDRAWEYTVAAGVEYWMSDRTMFYLEMRYDSDGLSGAEDSGAVQATLGAEVTF